MTLVPTLCLRSAALTHVGLRRAKNEDCIAIGTKIISESMVEPWVALQELDRPRICLVADGMGGHPAGDVASGLAASEVQRHFATYRGSPAELGDSMAEAVHRADARVRQEGDADPERNGMGTTLTALMIPLPPSRAVIGHIGDSRAYVYEGGHLRQLSRDHTWVQQQIDAGLLSPGDARGHPWAHVLSQALGVGDELPCDVIEREVVPGQVYLLCTDGLTTMLPDLAIERALEDALPRGIDAAARALVDAANDRGGVDNVTVALIAIEGD